MGPGHRDWDLHPSLFNRHVLEKSTSQPLTRDWINQCDNSRMDQIKVNYCVGCDIITINQYNI
eukprot:5534365-Ditylum_brightwellii.AAC.1